MQAVRSDITAALSSSLMFEPSCFNVSKIMARFNKGELSRVMPVYSSLLAAVCAFGAGGRWSSVYPTR